MDACVIHKLLTQLLTYFLFGEFNIKQKRLNLADFILSERTG
jgi:hypothetical protein